MGCISTSEINILIVIRGATSVGRCFVCGDDSGYDSRTKILTSLKVCKGSKNMGLFELFFNILCGLGIQGMGNERLIIQTIYINKKV